jgi:hypothetical protein
MASANPASNTSPTKSKADAAVKSTDLTLDCLKVDHSVVAKELAKFRACEPVTRTLYCREWAQYIYKRHFAYNAKTQEEMSQLRTISGPGGYKMCIGGPSPDTREIASSVCTRVSKQMESYFSEPQRNGPRQGEFLSNLLSECESWQKLPNSMSWLPDYFDPVVFDSFPDAIPLPDDPKDPSQLLDALIIDKSSLSLPSSCFHLLKNLNAEVLASQTQPICGHRKPMAKNPTELDVERKIFADKFEKVTTVVYSDIEKLLLDVWKDLNATLSGLKSLMAFWRKEMGPDLILMLSEFCRSNRDKLMGFNEYWSPYAENFKKKKSTTSVGDIDMAFYQYLDNIREIANSFEKDFMGSRYKSAISLVQSLQTLCGDVLQKKMEDMKRHGVEKFHKAVLDSCSTARNFVLKPEHLEHVQDNVEAVQDKMDVMLKELYEELDGIKEQYEKESQKNVVGRLEKIAHREFKKRVKKLESMQQNLRQNFASEFMANIFPEQQFAQMALVTLISVMQEGEQIECDEMDDFMFDFVDENEELLAQRDDLILDYEEGVHTGRTQLSGLVGKLYLKEGMRIQGDSLALKRQNSLLKSMGIATDTTDDSSASPANSGSGSKKKKKKKKNASSAATADIVQASEDTPVVAEMPTTAPPATSKAIAKAVPVVIKPAPPVPEATKPIAKAEPSKPAAAIPSSQVKIQIAKLPNRPAETINTDKVNKMVETDNVAGKAPAASKVSTNDSTNVVGSMPPKKTTDPSVSVKQSINGSATIQAATIAKPVTSKLDRTQKSTASIPQENKSDSLKPQTHTPRSTAQLVPVPSPKARISSVPLVGNDQPAPTTSPAPLKSKILFKSNALAELYSPTPAPAPAPAPPIDKLSASPVVANEVINSEKSVDNTWMARPNMPLWGESPNVSFAKAQSPTGASGWGEPEPKATPVLNHLWGQQSNSQQNSQSCWGEPTHIVADEHETTQMLRSSSTPASSVQSVGENKDVISDMIESNDAEPPITFKLSNLLEEDQESSPASSEKAEWNHPTANETARIQNVAGPTIAEAPEIRPHLPPGLQMGSSLGSNVPLIPFDNIGHQHSNALVSMVNNLQAENAQLINALLSVQQELNTVNARYGELIKLAREREAQKSIEMEEARRYALKLEAKLHLLERTENNNSFDFLKRSNERENGHSHSHSNDDYGRDDRSQRQPLSKPRHQSSVTGSEGQDRDRRRNMWRDNRVIKCGNCGEAGHKSSDCQVRVMFPFSSR